MVGGGEVEAVCSRCKKREVVQRAGRGRPRTLCDECRVEPFSEKYPRGVPPRRCGLPGCTEQLPAKPAGVGGRPKVYCSLRCRKAAEKVSPLKLLESQREALAEGFDAWLKPRSQQQ